MRLSQRKPTFATQVPKFRLHSGCSEVKCAVVFNNVWLKGCNVLLLGFNVFYLRGDNFYTWGILSYSTGATSHSWGLMLCSFSLKSYSSG